VLDVKDRFVLCSLLNNVLLSFVRKSRCRLKSFLLRMVTRCCITNLFLYFFKSEKGLLLLKLDIREYQSFQVPISEFLKIYMHICKE
jgi:hypothetical protein